MSSPNLAPLPDFDPLTSSGFDLRTAYQGSSLAGFSNALDELREAADRLRQDDDKSRLGQDLEMSVVEAARTVQQHMLGQLRHPEPTNQFKAIRADGAEADKALQNLMAEAAKYAKRSQQILVLPSNGPLADTAHLDDLINAVDKLREVSPSLAKAGLKEDQDPVTGLLADPDPAAMQRFAQDTAVTLSLIDDQIVGPKAVSDDFQKHLTIDRQIRPRLQQTMTALSETAPLAEIGQQAKLISSPTERLTYVQDALRLMQSSDTEPTIEGAVPAEGGALILPGTANGDAASAAGLIISDDIMAELDAVTTFENRRQDPQIGKAVIAFGEAHAGLKQQFEALFTDGETADGQLALETTADGDTKLDLTDRAKLGRAIAVRERIDALYAKQPVQAPETTAVILATTPQAELDLIQNSLSDTLGDGYRGSRDWQDPTARLALDIEIAAASLADQEAEIEKLVGRPDLADSLDGLQHAGLDEDSLSRLHQKNAVEALIDRFPNTAARIEAALGMSLQRPDFAAMGVELPTASSDAELEGPDQGQGLILPPGYKR
ncbi:MAG: hypothetical protein KI792_10765 [Alphaproteobacteria bacterium]|nr:hypothetical protein [Alphaproteobacteria bacterium SS10]